MAMQARNQYAHEIASPPQYDFQVQSMDGEYWVIAKCEHDNFIVAASVSSHDAQAVAYP